MQTKCSNCGYEGEMEYSTTFDQWNCPKCGYVLDDDSTDEDSERIDEEFISPLDILRIIKEGKQKDKKQEKKKTIQETKEKEEYKKKVDELQKEIEKLKSEKQEVIKPKEEYSTEKINFRNPFSYLNGIIFSEILAPPKSKRRRR